MGVALLFATRGSLAEGDRWLGAWFGSALLGALAGYLGHVISYRTLIVGRFIWRLIGILRWRGRLVLSVLAVGVISAVPPVAGAAIVRIAVIAPPAAFVLLFGVWTTVLADERLRGSRFHRVRLLPNLLAAAALGASLIALFDRDLLTTRPAAGALFPVGAWLSARIGPGAYGEPARSEHGAPGSRPDTESTSSASWPRRTPRPPTSRSGYASPAAHRPRDRRCSPRSCSRSIGSVRHAPARPTRPSPNATSPTTSDCCRPTRRRSPPASCTGCSRAARPGEMIRAPGEHPIEPHVP